MTTADILREARALYAANPSHVPGNEHPKDGTVCPITATTQVVLDNRPRVAFGACADADVLFARAAGCTADDIPAWNASASTKEVLAAFDRAIALAETSS